MSASYNKRVLQRMLGQRRDGASVGALHPIDRGSIEQVQTGNRTLTCSGEESPCRIQAMSI